MTASRVARSQATRIYGSDRHLRLWPESREQPFVMAVVKNELLWWKGPDYVRATTDRGVLARTGMATPFFDGHGD